MEPSKFIQGENWRQIDDPSYLLALKTILQKCYLIWDEEVLAGLTTAIDNGFRKLCVHSMDDDKYELAVYLKPEETSKYSYELCFIMQHENFQHVQSWVQPDISSIYQEISKEYREIFKGYALKDLYETATKL